MAKRQDEYVRVFDARSGEYMLVPRSLAEQVNARPPNPQHDTLDPVVYLVDVEDDDEG